MEDRPEPSLPLSLRLGPARNVLVEGGSSSDSGTGSAICTAAYACKPMFNGHPDSFSRCRDLVVMGFHIHKVLLLQGMLRLTNESPDVPTGPTHAYVAGTITSNTYLLKGR